MDIKDLTNLLEQLKKFKREYNETWIKRAIDDLLDEILLRIIEKFDELNEN